MVKAETARQCGIAASGLVGVGSKGNGRRDRSVSGVDR